MLVFIENEAVLLCVTTQERAREFEGTMSALFDVALKLLLLLHQEFGAASQKVTKNVVLLTNLKQRLNFGIQKIALANFAKLTYIK